MNAELDALYQATILDHYRNPRNFRAMQHGAKAEGHNPICGDRVTVYVHLENGIVSDASFEGYGCAIAMASASLMTEQLRGRTVDETRSAIDSFKSLDALGAFEGVRQFPSRLKCATLPWEACLAALGGIAEVDG